MDFIPMLGTYTYNLDAKNRIFIPAKHREALGSNFVIFPNPKDRRCVIISTVAYMEELMEKIRLDDSMPADIRSGLRGYLSGFGDTLTTDTQGRVVIDSKLVAAAGLGGSTVIHGCYNHAEVWNAAVFNPVTPEQADRFAEFFKNSNIVL